MYDDAGATAVPSAIDHELRFGSGEPLSLGVEEELFLVDPATGEELNCSEDVVARATPPARGSLSPELHACQVELITDVCGTAAEAMEVLATPRTATAATPGSPPHAR